MSEDLKLDEDDLETILAIGNNEQSGRVTNFELKELVRVYREYSSSQARLSEAVKVLEEAEEALEIAGGFIAAVPESVTVAGDSAMYAIDTAYSQAKAFLATLGEEK